MARAAYALRFFRVVPPVSGLIGWTFAVIVAVDTVVILVDASKASAAIVPLLLLQLFAASSGYALPARRGHYDLLLTGGDSRFWLATVHWLTSVYPGVTAWLFVAAMEMAASGGARRTLLASGTYVAMCLVSTLPWAITIRLPRFSGGIGWILVLSMSTSLVAPALDVEPLRSTVSPAAWAWSAWSFLVYPARFAGQELSWMEALSTVPALTIACAAMITACRWIVRTSVPLEASQ